MNAYFPLFIPESLLHKEAEHVEGFAPQVAYVTHGGGEELEERLVVRPTSEAIIGTIAPNGCNRGATSNPHQPMGQRGALGKGDAAFPPDDGVPLAGGHTAHETEAEAEEETRKILDLYKETVETEEVARCRGIRARARSSQARCARARSRP